MNDMFLPNSWIFMVTDLLAVSGFGSHFSKGDWYKVSYD
jgi:hypothetical protein